MLIPNLQYSDEKLQSFYYLNEDRYILKNCNAGKSFNCIQQVIAEICILLKSNIVFHLQTVLTQIIRTRVIYQPIPTNLLS